MGKKKDEQRQTFEQTVSMKMSQAMTAAFNFGMATQRMNVAHSEYHQAQLLSNQTIDAVMALILPPEKEELN